MSSQNWQEIVRLLEPARLKYEGLSSNLQAEVDEHLEVIASDPTPSPGGLPITANPRPPWDTYVYRDRLWEIHFAVEPRPNFRFEIYVGDIIHLLDDLMP